MINKKEALEIVAKGLATIEQDLASIKQEIEESKAKGLPTEMLENQLIAGKGYYSFYKHHFSIFLEAQEIEEEGMTRQEVIELINQADRDARNIREEIKKNKKEGKPTDTLEKQLDLAIDKYFAAQSIACKLTYGS